MAARLVVLSICVLGLNSLPVQASDSVETGVSLRSSEVSAVVIGGPQLTVEPRVSPRVARRNQRKITASFRIALEKVREVPECQEIFTKLGADGVSALSGMRFYPIGSHELKPNVCSGSAVHTLVGGGPIWVCQKFSRLSNAQAAMVILHEALHHAGLTEQPHDPRGMTSGAINDMVLKRCGL